MAVATLDHVYARRQAYRDSLVDERGRYLQKRPLRKRLEVYSIPGFATANMLVYPFVHLVWFGIWETLIWIPFLLAFWAYRGFGITIGFHRLATHKSFKASWLLKLILWSGGSAAGQGRIGKWQADHEDHHISPDDIGDPHSPLLNLLHAHFKWLAHHITPNLEERVERMQRQDRIFAFMHKTYAIWFLLSFIIPTALFGWQGFFWSWANLGWVYNITFSVNSVCHKWGKRPFDTDDLSTDNWIVEILGLGEGFHNGHHAFQWSALHALQHPRRDLSYQVIRLYGFLHLAEKGSVRVPNKSQIEGKLVAA